MSVLRKSILVLCMLAISLLASLSVSAADITWSGNGTTGGSCNNLQYDPSIPQGQQQWLFVLTGPGLTGPYSLNATFNTGSYNGVVGTQQGGGAVQFTVLTAENAILQSATATTGSGGNNLVVSHCSINPPPLQVTKTANTSFVRTYLWTIEKSVSPERLDMFTGDSESVTYTVGVTKSGPYDSDWAVNGTISVYNPSGFTATVTGVNDNISGYGSVGVNCGVGFPYALGAGQTLNCSYGTGLPDGSSRTNSATAATSGAVPGGSGSADVIFGSPSTVVNGSINVDDSNGGSWSFGDTGSVQYERTFSCNADAGMHNNTATIRETGQSDNASVTVYCYAPVVSKDAGTSYTRTWNWTIDKTGDQTDVTLSTGQIFQSVHYTVALGAASSDSDWTVSGTITVQNPNPYASMTVSVGDSLAGAVIDCGGGPGDTDLTVSAGSSATCSYSAAVSGAVAGMNTATATLNSLGYSGSAPYSFGDPTNEIDECVTVSDDKVGNLGLVCADFAVKTFNYSMDIGPYDTCGEYSFVNIATFVSTETPGKTGSDNHTVNVHVPCGGCTLTLGYWKTHSDRGPAPYDNGWKAIGVLEEDTLFFKSTKTWYAVFWTPPAGNAYYNLAHQYMAAKLNILNGAASTSAVDAAIAGAEALFNAQGINDVTLTTAERKTALAYASTLDSYNNGLIGPGHCNE